MLGRPRTRLAATLVVSAVTALFFLCGGTVSASAHLNPAGHSASPARTADVGTKHVRSHGTPAAHVSRATAPQPHATDTGPASLQPDVVVVGAPNGRATVSADESRLRQQHRLRPSSRGPPA